MFFILSKVLFFLLFPFSWVIILWIWMLLSKLEKRKRILRNVILVIFIVFTNPFIYSMLVLAWQPMPVAIPAGKTYNAGIVLGGMAGFDKNGRGHFGNNSDRFIQTANLYHQGVIKKIIITGGTGSLSQREPPEAFFLQKAFIDNGIPAGDIIIETRSRNTYENAIFTKRIIDSIHLAPPYVLITSSLHMRRSEQVFKKAGFQYIPFPCDYKVVPLGFAPGDYFLPNAGLLNDWGGFLKEMIGLAVYKLTGKA